MDPDNRTNPDISGHNLGPRQSRAIDLLLSGQNDRQVAEVLGVRRQTVCDWRHEDEFAAELADRRRELWEPFVSQLRTILPKAIRTLEASLVTYASDADGHLALKVIKLLGLTEACQSVPLPPANKPAVAPIPLPLTLKEVGPAAEDRLTKTLLTARDQARNKPS